MNLVSSKFSLGLLFVSILAVFTTKGFLNSWVILELNFMVFILWATTSGHTSIGIRYFYVQALLSGLILLSFSLLGSGVNNKFTLIFFTLVLLSKMGLPPVYAWFISICVFSSYDMIFVISSLQKIIPLYILVNLNSGLIKPWFLLTLMILLKSLYNLISLKKLIAYSSLFNLLWMILASSNLFLVFYYLAFYSIALFLFLYMAVHKGQMEVDSDIFMKGGSFNLLVSVFLMLLSMAGMPPFANFYIKLMIVESVSCLAPGALDMASALLLSGVLLTLMYVQLIYSAVTQNKFLNCHSKSLWNFPYLMFLVVMVAPYFLFLI